MASTTNLCKIVLLLISLTLSHSAYIKIELVKWDASVKPATSKTIITYQWDASKQPDVDPKCPKSGKALDTRKAEGTSNRFLTFLGFNRHYIFNIHWVPNTRLVHLEWNGEKPHTVDYTTPTRTQFAYKIGKQEYSLYLTYTKAKDDKTALPYPINDCSTSQTKTKNPGTQVSSTNFNKVVELMLLQMLQGSLGGYRSNPYRGTYAVDPRVRGGYPLYGYP